MALVGHMYKDLVEERAWISDLDYKDGLALAQLAPGPLAAQLAIYLGYVHFRILGATLVGIAFVLPSFLMVVALGWAYQRYGGLPWMQAVFYGIGACVIGIITHSPAKLTKKTVGRDKLLWGVYLVAAVVTAITESETIWIFLVGGIFLWLVKTPPAFLKSKTGLAAVSLPALWIMFLFFAKAGTFVFGSGLAIVPFLFSGVVKEFHWLNDRQFLDAVAVAMITPGPVVITVGFIGYLVYGLTGAVVAAFGTFFPCYLFTIIPAPYFKKYGKRPGIAAFVDGVTAAAIGTLCGAVIVLARKSLVDVPTILFAAATLVLLWRAKKIPEPLLVLGAGLLGLLLKFWIKT